MNNFIVGLANIAPTPNAPLTIAYSRCGQWLGDATLSRNLMMTCITGLSAARYVIILIEEASQTMNFCELQVFIS